MKTANGTYELTFWNEYMFVEKAGKRLVTFPDLIATLSVETRLPLTTTDITPGQQIAILHIPQEHLKLGAGMKYPQLFQNIEDVTGKEIINYSFSSQ